MTRPRSALEVAAATLGGLTWGLAGAAGLVLLSGREDEGLDALGTGLLFLLVLVPAGLCAVATLALLVAAGVRARGRLAAATWVLALVPALAGGYLVVDRLVPSERSPAPQRQILPPPVLPPPLPVPSLMGIPSPLPPPPPLPPPVEVPLPTFVFEPIPPFELETAPPFAPP